MFTLSKEKIAKFKQIIRYKELQNTQNYLLKQI